MDDSQPPGAVIALVGIDGAGKTTQARRLTSRLVERGIPADYHLAASGRRVLSNVAKRLGRGDSIALLGPRTAMRAETAMRRLNLSWSLRADLLVADRYSYCQFARTRMLCPEVEPWVRKAMRGVPRPALTLFLDLPPELASERVAVRGIDEEPVDRLRALDRAYRELPEAAAFTYIDATGTTDEVSVRIDEWVDKLLAGGELGVEFPDIDEGGDDR
ncbi:thymidylate kinase [Phytomonospora sp. NPDC050363]|uniref:dTMP kinase n=1 Tax=Phytomonospora sp. NPDC050363 TaxID=3155642 RepID=UPI0033E7F3AD